MKALILTSEDVQTLPACERVGLVYPWFEPDAARMVKTVVSAEAAGVRQFWSTQGPVPTAGAEHFWSPKYIQHSAHIPPGREGLFNLVKSTPPTLKYEPGTIVADGDFVMVHGRYSGQPVNWIIVDIIRIQDGMLIEHGDVIQDEATHEQSKSVLPMFGKKFPNAWGRRRRNSGAREGDVVAIGVDISSFICPCLDIISIRISDYTSFSFTGVYNPEQSGERSSQ